MVHICEMVNPIETCALMKNELTLPWSWTQYEQKATNYMACYNLG